MAFTPIEWDKIKVGDPITKELMDQIKGNFDDLDSRLNQSETTGGSVFVLNRDFCLAGLDMSRPNIFYYKAQQDFSITEFRVQIQSKGTITTGTLSLDLKKASVSTPSTFNSVLTGTVNFNYASDAAYSEKTGSLNTSNSDVTVGDILKIEVTGRPSTDFGGTIICSIGGE